MKYICPVCGAELTEQECQCPECGEYVSGDPKQRNDNWHKYGNDVLTPDWD